VIRELRERLAHDDRVVFVLDDDPTGSQAVSNVQVILKPEKQLFRQVWRDGRRCAFVLTNTRSMNERDAVRLITGIRRDIESAAEEDGVRVAFVLRGDSTLRGHVFAEMNVFRGPRSVGLFVPAFPACGRVTLDGVHYLIQDDGRMPMHETEFAQDPVFGYKSGTLQDWVAEVGKGWIPRLVPLGRLRQLGARAVAEALKLAEPGEIVIPDAETDEDIEAIVLGMMIAENEGVDVVARSAATFAAFRCGSESVRVTPDSAPGGGILAVCGSHTAASTRQLERLVCHFDVEPVVVPTASLFEEGVTAVVRRSAGLLIRQLSEKGFGLLVSERTRQARFADLESGARVMEAITRTKTRLLRGSPGEAGDRLRADAGSRRRL